MGVRVECDWCRQAIASGEPYVTVAIDGKIIRGSRGNGPEDVSQAARVYCGQDRYSDEDPAANSARAGYSSGRPERGHRESCARRMLAALTGNPDGRADCGMEWRLVPQAAPNAERLIEAPVIRLDLHGRTLKALQNAGITSVRELASLTQAQLFAVKGIGRGSAEEVRKALHRHENVDIKDLAAAEVTA